MQMQRSQQALSFSGQPNIVERAMDAHGDDKLPLRYDRRKALFLHYLSQISLSMAKVLPGVFLNHFLDGEKNWREGIEACQRSIVKNNLPASNCTELAKKILCMENMG